LAAERAEVVFSIWVVFKRKVGKFSQLLEDRWQVPSARTPGAVAILPPLLAALN
jgi:hypothetical protein